MSAAFATHPRAGDGAPLALTFDAIGEAASIAEAYSRTAADFAALGYGRGVRYALRQAAVALASAVSTAQALRPAQQDGGSR